MINEECINNENDYHVPPLRAHDLYIIEFDVKRGGKGAAIVAAPNPNEAERMLKSEGMYNGDPTYYKITRIERIDLPLVPMIVAEQVIK